MSSNDAEQAIQYLLDLRGPGKSICPSEVAKRIVPPNDNWRSKMDEIHKTVDMMVDTGSIELFWKGQPMQRRRGPYRITRRRNI